MMHERFDRRKGFLCYFRTFRARAALMVSEWKAVRSGRKNQCKVGIRNIDAYREIRWDQGNRHDGPGQEMALSENKKSDMKVSFPKAESGKACFCSAAKVQIIKTEKHPKIEELCQRYWVFSRIYPCKFFENVV